MLELGAQLWNPIGLSALGINLILFLVPPCLALYFADAPTRRLALAMGLLAGAVRLIGWSSLPAGTGSDDFATLAQMTHQVVNLRSLYGENWDNGGNLFTNLPWYLAYRLSGSVLAIRFVGTLWSVSLAVVVYCFAAKLYGRFPALVCAAIATLTVWSLFISRLTFGSEILVLEACIIWVAWILKRQIDEDRPISLWLIVILGLLAALSLHTYLAARILVLMPVVIVGVWGRSRLALLCLVFAIVSSALHPYLLTRPDTIFAAGSQLNTLRDPLLGDPTHVLTKMLSILRSFVDPRYSGSGTNAMPGALAVGWTISIVVLSGVPFAFRFFLAGMLGALPVLVSTLYGGGSHRMMTMLVPLALVAGAGLGRLPARPQKWLSVMLTLMILVISVATWISDDYWASVDHDLTTNIALHRISHRERKLNPNTAILGRDTVQGLISAETRSSGAEITTVDCSRPFTLVLDTDPAYTRLAAETLGGEVVAGTRDWVAVLHLKPADALNPVLQELHFCRVPPPSPDTDNAAPPPRPPARDPGVMMRLRGDVALWLKADAIEGMQDGAFVSRWPASIGAHDAAQPNDDMRPSYRSHARNNLPAVTFFSGRSNSMSVLDLPLAAHSSSFFVLRANSGNLPFFEHGPNFNANPGFLLYGSGPMFGVFRHGILDFARGPADWPYNQWLVISATYDDSESPARFRVRRNGIPELISPSTRRPVEDSNVVETFHIGARDQTTFWSDMDLGEVILINKPLSYREVEEVERYLAAKWDIALGDRPGSLRSRRSRRGSTQVVPR